MESSGARQQGLEPLPEGALETAWYGPDGTPAPQPYSNHASILERLKTAGQLSALSVLLLPGEKLAKAQNTVTCRFHEDKKPSLSVNVEKGLYHCFGCQASGDLVDMAAELRFGGDTPAAIDWIRTTFLGEKSSPRTAFEPEPGDVNWHLEWRENAGSTEPPRVEFTAQTAPDLIDTELPPLHWLVGDSLIRRPGVHSIVAPQKTGKSMALMRLALAVAGDTTAGHWLGSPVLETCPVLYLSGEGGAHLVQERLKKMSFDPPAGLTILHQRPFPDIARRDHLDQLWEQFGPFGLLLVDPLSRFRKIEDENDASCVTEFHATVDQFGIDYDVGSVLAHHESHSRRDEPSGGGRGSTAAGAEPDALIHLRRNANSRDAIDAHFELRWGKHIEPRLLHLNMQTLDLEYQGELGARKRSPQTEQQFSLEMVYDALPTDPMNGILVRDIAAKMGCQMRTAHKLVNQLRRQGTILVKKRGGPFPDQIHRIRIDR